jgi:hypothetical protein
MWAWGAKDFVNTGTGLQFRVGGMAKFKGLVHVVYVAGEDLYTVQFMKMRKGVLNVVQEVTSVYAEDLVVTIDEVVQ